MIADNDAGGITTYAATGAKYGYNLIWFLIILVPVAYYVQEMTVRLGAVTKRGHAEAIFDAFGSFWGWFSLVDLMILDWLTLVTEFIGMTAAMRIFGVPEWLTVLAVCLLMGRSKQADIRHSWVCDGCDYQFETLIRFNAAGA
jgi:Mn2+/Fe2+ NRAMP family transporter